MITNNKLSEVTVRGVVKGKSYFNTFDTYNI